MKIHSYVNIFVISVLFASCSLEKSPSQSSSSGPKPTIELDEDGYIVELGSGLDIDTLSESDQESLPIRSYKFFGGNSRELASLDEPEQNQEEQSKQEPRVFQNYEIQKGDTLLSIAFEIYGDYREWKSLLRDNEALKLEVSKLEPGTMIRYLPPENRPQRPRGISYIIKKDETLFKISRKVYDGEGRYWPALYENNRPFIRDPDLIFPGFSLYYLPLEEVQINHQQLLSQHYSKP